MGTNHVGVFYDGIELGNAQNGVIDLGRFSLDNMEAVTLYNGQEKCHFPTGERFWFCRFYLSPVENTRFSGG